MQRIRPYFWLLNETEKKKVAELMVHAAECRKKKGPMVEAVLIDDAGSSSSSAAVVVRKGKKAAISNPAKVAGPAKISKGSGIMKFFR